MPAVCTNCHKLRDLCGDCHHKGAGRAAWLQTHPKTVTSGGAAQCFENCHKKDFCVKCHTGQRVLPTSHKAANWLHGSASKRATHTTVYTANADSCTYCHGDGGAKSKFCSGCHKLEMPHPATFGPADGQPLNKNNGGDHMQLLTKGKGNRGTCNNCHAASFCDACHHKDGYSAKLPWGVAKVGVKQQHPNQVRAKGTQPCFDCHQETYCSHCHVTASR